MTPDLDQLNFEEKLLLFRQLGDQLAAQALPDQVDPLIFRQKSVPQSQLFMVDLIPMIHRLFFGAPVNSSIEVLDVGPASMSGTKLLADLHAPESFNNLKMSVEAIDLFDTWERYGQFAAPDIPLMIGNIFDLDPKPWDLVLCSHVIEHVPDPKSFIDALRRLSSGYVIVACPFQENPLSTVGHVNTIDKRFLRLAGAIEVNVYTNYMWGKDREVVIAVFRGSMS